MRYACRVKILFTRFPLESRTGGAEVHTVSLMKGLIERGHAVTFLGGCPTLLTLCQEESIPTVECEIGPPPVTRWSAISFFWRKGAMQRRLDTACDEFHDIDVVCMLSLSEKLLLTSSAAASGTRVFWIEHDRVGSWLTKNPWLPQLRRTSTYAHTICVSELSRKIYLDLGWPPERTIAIPNGIDTVRLKACHAPSPADALRQAQGDTVHIGTVARLSHDKGLDLLIEAIARLPNVSLTIIGEGREENALRALIQAKKLRDRVTVLPTVDDLGGFYRSLDLFVLPSRKHDPFGLSAAEAMMLGVPTIVTDACGIAGYLHDGSDAIVVPANDPRALAQAISQLSDASLRSRIAENATKKAEKQFSVERMVNEYEAILRGAPSH